MKLTPDLLKEVKKVALTVLILCAVMVVVFVLIGKFDYTVALGAVYGGIGATAYFYLLALSVLKLTSSVTPLSQEEVDELDKRESEADNVTGRRKHKKPMTEEGAAAKKRMQMSYTGRLLFVGGIAVIGVIAPCFNTYAALIPLLFPRIAISVTNMFASKKEKSEGGGEKS